MALTCTFNNDKYEEGTLYVCKIESQSIPVDVLNISGKHKPEKSNQDVKVVRFIGCEMSKVPQGLTRIFPDMKILSILDSQLKNINKLDMSEYHLLEKLYFLRNKTEFLPGDLFDGFAHLEAISFYGNKLKIIEPNILDGLSNLKHVDFRNNPNYTKCCSLQSKYEHATFEEVKSELCLVFGKNFENYRKIMLKKFEDSSKMAKEGVKQNNSELQKGISSDLKALIDDEYFKDFKIQVGDREFNVHKFLLIARSPKLAEIIRNNPVVEKLDLLDISVDTFEIILKYIYTDEFSPVDDDFDAACLFAAAGRLKMSQLKNFAAEYMLDQINGDNAIEVLKLSIKYDNVELRERAFDEIKKKYPKIELDKGLAAEPEIVEIEEAVRMFKDDLKKSAKQGMLRSKGNLTSRMI